MVNYGRNPDIGKILRQQRKSITLTMREVSERSGVSPSHLSRIERGGRFPSASVLRRLAGPLGFEEAELMMLAGYLSPLKQGITEERKGSRTGKLDPYVAQVLSHEPLEVQRAVINILMLVKHLAAALKKTNNK